MAAELLGANGERGGQSRSLSGLQKPIVCCGSHHAQHPDSSFIAATPFLFWSGELDSNDGEQRPLPASNRNRTGGIMRAPFLLGRLMFGGYFIVSGINHFKNKGQMTQYTAAKNVPQPEVAVPATGAALIAGGASILLGVKPKLGAAGLVGFLVGVSPIMHDFWKQEDPQQRMNDTINFMKNLALAGGALALMAVEEPWPASVPVMKVSRVHRAKRFLREIAA
jgi:putative oxidoreductase